MALEHMKLDYNISSQQMDYLKQFTNDYVDSGLIKSESVPDVNSFINDLVDTSYLSQANDLQPVPLRLCPDHRKARLP